MIILLVVVHLPVPPLQLHYLPRTPLQITVVMVHITREKLKLVVQQLKALMVVIIMFWIKVRLFCWKTSHKTNIFYYIWFVAFVVELLIFILFLTLIKAYFATVFSRYYRYMAFAMHRANMLSTQYVNGRYVSSPLILKVFQTFLNIILPFHQDSKTSKKVIAFISEAYKSKWMITFFQHRHCTQML